MLRLDEKDALIASSSKKQTSTNKPEPKFSIADKAFNIPLISQLIGEFIPFKLRRDNQDERWDHRGLSAFSQINKLTFHATRNCQRYTRCSIFGDEYDVKPPHVNDRHALSAFTKAKSAIYPNPVIQSVLLSGDLKAITKEIKHRNLTAQSDHKDQLQAIYSIVLAGNTVALKLLFKQIGLTKDTFKDPADVILLQKYSVISGQVKMAKFIRGTLNNFLFDEKADSKIKNEHALLLTAIESGVTSMVDYVLSFIRKENLQKISVATAVDCWKAAFHSQNLKLMQKIQNIPAIVSAIRWDLSSKKDYLNSRDIDSLCIMITRNSFAEVQAAWTFLMSTPTLKFDPTFLSPCFYWGMKKYDLNKNHVAIYRACLHRDQEFRRKICALFNIDFKQFLEDFKFRIFDFSLNHAESFFNYLQDYETDYKNIPCRKEQGSITKILSWEGDLELLKHAIEIWKIAPTINSASDATGFLTEAAKSLNTAKFLYVWNYLKTHHSHFINDISWVSVISQIWNYNREGYLLPMIKTVTELMRENKVVEEYKPQNPFGRKCKVTLDYQNIIFFCLYLNFCNFPFSVVKYLTEEFGLKEKIIKPFPVHTMLPFSRDFNSDPILNLIGRTGEMHRDQIRILKYLISDLKCDFKEASAKLAELMIGPYSERGFFKPRPELNGLSINEYLAKNGWEISQADLDKFKTDQMTHHHYETVEAFNLAFPRYNVLYPKLNKSNPPKEIASTEKAEIAIQQLGILTYLEPEKKADYEACYSFDILPGIFSRSDAKANAASLISPPPPRFDMASLLQQSTDAAGAVADNVQGDQPQAAAKVNLGDVKL